MRPPRPTPLAAAGGPASPERTAWLVLICAQGAVVGLGMTVFQVCHLPLIKQRFAADEAVATVALAMAISCYGIGGIVGNTLGGVVVESLGVGAAYAVELGLGLVALVLVLLVPIEEDDEGEEESQERAREEEQMAEEEQTANCASLCSNKEYLGIILVTVFSNLFYWCLVPFIQVIASRLGTTPSEAGLLASATGWGNLLGALTVVALPPRRIGLTFVGGALSASLFFAAAAVRSYAVVLLGLFVASVGGGLFGATQSTLVMLSLPPSQHGLGMGILSAAIGAQAAGMLMLGEIGSYFDQSVGLVEGPSYTVLSLAAAGVVTQAVSWCALPQLSRVTTKTTAVPAETKP